MTLRSSVDSHERILIVGGGIFGVAAADALATLGFSQIEVLEQGRLGEAATAHAAGIVSLHTWNDDDARLIHETRQGLELLREWARSHEHPAAESFWNPVGGVTVADGRHAATLEAMHARLKKLDLKGEALDATEAARRFQQFRFAQRERVLWGADDGYVESTDCLDALRRRSMARGVRFRENVPVRQIRHADGAVTGIALEGSAQRADHVVVAGGAWTKAFLARSGHAIAAIPYRTQLATLELPGADALPVLHDTVHHFYSRPESSTRFLAGDGTQLRPFDPDSFDRAADGDFIESIANRIVQRFVQGEDVRFRNGWAGLCVGTPDRRPLAGTLIPGLHVLTGDNGFGVMRSLALGRVVAESVAGKTPPPSLDPTRFGPSPPAEFELGEGFSLP